MHTMLACVGGICQRHAALQAWVPPDKRQTVLVTDGDSPMGEATIAQLILAR